MPMPDFNALTGAMYARLKYDDAGAAFRTRLHATDGAKRITQAIKLDTGNHPPVLFAAFKDLPITNSDGMIFVAVYQWWFYDNLSEGNWAINELIQLAGDAYKIPIVAAKCAISSVEFGDITEGNEDTALNLWQRSAQISVTFL